MGDKAHNVHITVEQQHSPMLFAEFCLPTGLSVLAELHWTRKMGKYVDRLSFPPSSERDVNNNTLAEAVSSEHATRRRENPAESGYMDNRGSVLLLQRINSF